MTFLVVVFVTFCMPIAEGGVKCLDKSAVVNTSVVADRDTCDDMANEINFMFLENDVRYINAGDKTFFFPGAACEEVVD